MSVNERPQYRISDYARYMGVTPDLLKHYEEVGLITPTRSRSGYRQYPFNTSPILMECARLRNYGFTLKEIRDLLDPASASSPEDIKKSMQEKLDRMAFSVKKKQCLLSSARSIKAFTEVLGDRSWDWEIRNTSEAIFLPHSLGYRFLEDPAIYEVLRDWMDVIPIVRSTLQVRPGEPPVWGLSVLASDAEALSLPVSEACQRIAPAKCLYCSFHDFLPESGEERPDNPDHPVQRILSSLNLPPADSWYRVCLQPGSQKGGRQRQYGFYAAAIQAP